jgi:hypothetical protein
VEHADTDRQTPKSRELPDPDERSRYYEAMHARVSAETAGGASPGHRPDGIGQQSYWDAAPRFLEMRDDIKQRWPAERRPAADRPADPPGTAEAIGRMCKAERGLSADAQAIKQENGYGGWLEGFQFRLKGEDRLKEKIAEQLEAEPDNSPAEILGKIPDAIRYTFCFPSESYTRGYYDVKERLESRGYEMYYSRNWWTDPEYKGINTRLVTPEGQRFEVQFHTPESFHAKHHVTHAAYERIRNPSTSRAELRELHAFQREVSSWIQVPDGAADIPDFKQEGF